MHSIIRILGLFAFCGILAACGNDTTTTTTTATDTTTANGSPMSPMASDNTGAGIEGSTGPGANMDTGSVTPDGTKGRNNAGDDRGPKHDTVNNRSGLAPSK